MADVVLVRLDGLKLLDRDALSLTDKPLGVVCDNINIDVVLEKADRLLPIDRGMFFSIDEFPNVGDGNNKDFELEKLVSLLGSVRTR